MRRITEKEMLIICVDYIIAKEENLPDKCQAYVIPKWWVSYRNVLGRDVVFEAVRKKLKEIREKE